MSVEEQALFEYTEILKLLRKYMARIQPQCFASAYGIFLKLKNRCECFGIVLTDDSSDIFTYAKAENIERFNFDY